MVERRGAQDHKLAQPPLGRLVAAQRPREVDPRAQELRRVGERLVQVDLLRAELLVRDNRLASGELPFAGNTLRLKDIKRPFLNIYCEQDTIVPAPSAAPLTGLVGSRDASELKLEVGHVGLVAGRYAEEVARPAIADWIRRHSANRKTSTPKENGDRHTARAAAA